MVSKHVLPFIPHGVPYGFDSLMLDLLKNERAVGVRSYSGHWLDIGRPDDYIEAIEQFDSMKEKFLNA